MIISKTFDLPEINESNDDAFENEQVRRIAGGEIVWVGGIRKDCGNGPGSDFWKWSNGKEWFYTNWRAGEPNNYTKHDENRVMLWENGEWTAITSSDMVAATRLSVKDLNLHNHGYDTDLVGSHSL